MDWPRQSTAVDTRRGVPPCGCDLPPHPASRAIARGKRDSPFGQDALCARAHTVRCALRRRECLAVAMGWGHHATFGEGPRHFAKSVWQFQQDQCRGSGQPSAHDPSPASNPPSASNTLPVIRFAIGDTQNRMTRAMSSGAPARPSRLAAAAPETSIPAAVSTSA